MNIKKYIDSFKEKIKLSSNEETIKKIIISNILTTDDFLCKINNGILSFTYISPILRTKIKLRKKELLIEFKKNNIYIRDII